MSVYVVQQPKPGPQNFTYDISPALEFGQPIFVFEGSDQPGLTPAPSMQRARKVLETFNDNDYILWAGGDPAGLAIVSMIAAEINQGRVNFLRWERRRDPETSKRTGLGYYVKVSLDGRTRRR